MAVVGAITGETWFANNRSKASYLEEGDIPANFGKFMIFVGIWVLMMTNLVPISLIVSLEFVRLFQAVFMSWDLDMFDADQDMDM